MPAPIGSLVASLTLESAAFIRDLGKAANSVNANTSKMARSFEGIQRAAKMAFGGYLGVQGVRALANIARAAIDTGDEIGEAASKLGIGAEALQRLRFAASQTDVDVVALNLAMKQFQKQLATGQIKASTGDIAGAFAEWIDKIREAPTQLEKVELGVKAFGKQYQAALLIAAQGGTFTAAMRDAFVISQHGIDIASELDNKLREIQNAAEVGFNTGFLETFAGKLETSKGDLDSLNAAMRTLGEIAGTIALGAARLINTVSSFLEAHPEIKKFLDTRFGDVETESRVQLGKGTVVGKGVLNLPPMATATGEGGRTGVGGINLPAGDPKKQEAAFTASADALALQKKMAQEAAQAFSELANASNKVWDDTRTPMEEYANNVEHLNFLLKEHAISAETFARAHQQLTLGMAANWLGAAGAVAGALAGIFKDNKAFAVAEAVINTASAVVAALKNPPGPPYSYVYAAAAAATGAAQIATILATQPGSGAKSTTLKKGATPATAASSTATSSSKRAGPSQMVTIKIEGDVFGPEHFRRIVAGINGVQRDGTALLQVA